MSETLHELCTKLYDAKRTEDAAKEARIAVEEQIVALVNVGERETKTVDAGEGLKVTVKKAVSYKADLAAIEALKLPPEMNPVKRVPETTEFDEAGYEWLREHHPEVAARIDRFVEVKPRKPAVTLKLK